MDMLPALMARLFAILAPLAVCVGIGYGWARSGRRIDNEFVVNLLVNVSLPCLIFSKMTSSGLGPAHMGMTFLSALLGTLLLMLIGPGVLHLVGINPRAGLSSVAFPNMGNMGIPICMLGFGDQGAVLATIYFFTSSLFNHGVNAQMMTGGFTLAKIIRLPLIYGVGGAVLFMLTEWPVPEALANTTKILGDMVIPIMLIALGVSLAGLRVADMRRSAVIVMIRLAVGWTAAMVVVLLFDLRGAPAAVAILQFTMPCAVVNYLYAQSHGIEPELVAGAVFLSTILSVITIPVTLIFLLPGF